jgi:cysteine desulfurase
MAYFQRIYLDYAATTPVDPVVFRAMEPYFMSRFGNAGSLHSFGQEAIVALDAARETVAASVGADFQEMIFTGSATEANNLVLRGVIGRSPGTDRQSLRPQIIISSIEHESILEAARNLENSGVDVVYLPVDKTGTVDLKKLEASLNKNTVLVSVMYANNEIGTIQPIEKIRRIINDFKKNRSPITDRQLPLFHTDASQAFQFLDCNITKLSVDFMTLSSHKIYGPKGVGTLYVGARPKRSAISDSLLVPQIMGGGQEFGLRSGTENIPAIVGFAKAIELLIDSRKLANKRIEELRGELFRGIKKICPKAKINGAPFSGPAITSHLLCLPNILNVYFPKHDAQDLLTKFDLLGLAVSSGSACRARASRTSYVIEALGYPKERARSSVRFSLGRPTTGKEIIQALAIIKKTIQSEK